MVTAKAQDLGGRVVSATRTQMPHQSTFSETRAFVTRDVHYWRLSSRAFIAHSRAAYLYWYLETAASGWQFTRAAGAESNRLREAPSRVTTQMVRPDDLREAHVSLQRSAWAPPHRRRRWGHDGYRCVRRKAPAAPGPDAHAPQRMAKCPPRLRRPSEQPVPRSLSRPIAEPGRDNLCAS